MTRPVLLFLVALALAQAQTWKADWQVLKQHKVPAWILDAKLGVQYVGPQMDLDDWQMYHWQRSAQRHRHLGSPPPDRHVEAMHSKFRVLGGLPYAWVHKPIENVDEVLARYKDIGAKFMVSMLWGAYPGTEGLLMDQKEVEAARRLGMKVGLHYNLLRRDGVPSIGDAGYMEWLHQHLQQHIQRIGSDFVFFDGCQAHSEYFKSAEFLAWYYNWADRNGKEVWVNDDLGLDLQESGEYGDLVDHEGFTVQGISPKPWINWDILRNEWTCWVNEFGVHKQKGGPKWVWEYKKPEDVLLRFIDTVSKGGVWIVQMDNTKTAWQNMDEIGAWLKVNGEAIYGTRPYGEPAPKMVRLPRGPRPKGVVAHWMWQFEESVKLAKADGPLYFTRKGQDLYAIHWGWPGETLAVPNVRPPKGARIRMLGVEGDLDWEQTAPGISIKMPPQPAGKHAFTCRIPLGRAR
jgi:hypothetical protein